MAVVVITQSSGLVLVALASPFFGGTWIGADVAIASAGGLAGVFGLLCFYRSLAIGPMSVAAPLSAVLAALVPVVCGVALGERPALSAWIGIPLALLAVVLFSRTEAGNETTHAGSNVILLSTLAGLGFGGFFVSLDKVSANSGLLPIVSARAASVLVVLLALIVSRTPATVPRSVLPTALFCGLFDTLANVFVMLANRHGMLATVAVISSLYPAATVLLAQVVLKERFTKLHIYASITAILAVALIASGSSAGT